MCHANLCGCVGANCEDGYGVMEGGNRQSKRLRPAEVRAKASSHRYEAHGVDILVKVVVVGDQSDLVFDVPSEDTLVNRHP